MDQRDFKAFQSVSIQIANPRCEFAELPGTENWTEENVNIFEEEEGAMNVDDQIQVLRPRTHLRSPLAQHHLESRASPWDPAAPDHCLWSLWTYRVSVQPPVTHPSPPDSESPGVGSGCRCARHF